MVDFATRCYHPWMTGSKPSPNAEGWIPPVPIAINLHHHNGQIKKDFEVFVEYLRTEYGIKPQSKRGRIGEANQTRSQRFNFRAVEVHDIKSYLRDNKNPDASIRKLNSADHVAYHNYFSKNAKFGSRILEGLKVLKKLHPNLFS
jgi:hypothetical protein